MLNRKVLGFVLTLKTNTVISRIKGCRIFHTISSWKRNSLAIKGSIKCHHQISVAPICINTGCALIGSRCTLAILIAFFTVIRILPNISIIFLSFCIGGKIVTIITKDAWCCTSTCYTIWVYTTIRASATIVFAVHIISCKTSLACTIETIFNTVRKFKTVSSK